MKWYWRINYTITAFLLLIWLPFILGAGSFYKLFQILESIPFLNDLSIPLSIIVEWIQIPTGILVIRNKKNERTRLHYLYLLLLLIIGIAKCAFLWAIWSDLQ